MRPLNGKLYHVIALSSEVTYHGPTERLRFKVFKLLILLATKIAGYEQDSYFDVRYPCAVCGKYEKKLYTHSKDKLRKQLCAECMEEKDSKK